jgi:hypothetical protein
MVLRKTRQTSPRTARFEHARREMDDRSVGERVSPGARIGSRFALAT